MPESFRGFDYRAMYRELWREFPGIDARIVIGGGGDGELGWSDFLDRGASRGALSESLDLLRPGPNEVTELMFTSGTTG